VNTGDAKTSVLELLREVLPPNGRRRLKHSATLTEVGLDSMGLMILVGRFLEHHPISTAVFESRLPHVRTVADLLELADSALSQPTEEVGP
jgi:aryl carrier-like protein